ncbi:MAG: hypothetical protein L0Z62_12190 [Gemmataceae bacterium]|nr:hypothetical protein [Gemmataceae bacterium]
MRLTLRTLLAYLDDTLEPNQAKEIGQKVAESDTAQELITRIKQVTRRRRLTTPPDAGPGAKLDPNTIAGYLDNALDSDQLAEVEQTCLASDVHLAEVATCHQILTLVLGEPALVPPTAKQRMYGLVKGREAIPFRKPPAASAEPDEPPEGKEVDETLRLGLPALRRKGGWSNWAVIGGGATALVACLVVAIIMLLRSGGTEDPGGPAPKRESVARADKKKADSEKSVKDDKNGGGAADKSTDKGMGKDKEEPQPPTRDDSKKESAKDKKPEQPSDGVEPPAGPPSAKIVDIGRFEPPGPTDPPAILMQLRSPKEGGEWQRLKREVKPTPVWSGRPLVSLPTYRSKVLTNRGVRLTLWGTSPEFLPEFLPSPPVIESRVILHHSEPFDLDLTLVRGRVVLTSTKADKPLKVRLRFENSTGPNPNEVWDIALEQQGAEVLIDRWGFYPPGEPFYPDPKDPNRIGPISQAGLVVLNGSITVRVGDVTHSLNVPPGPALLFWDSLRGPQEPRQLKELPLFTRPRPPLPKGAPKALETQRADLDSAAKQLNSDLLTRAAELGLRQAMDSNKSAELKLAVRCYGALDMLPKVVDALGDKRQEVRQAAIDTLRHWCASSRDNDYRLLEVLKGPNKEGPYKEVEASNIVALLHLFSAKDRTRPETYDVLITKLTTPQTPLPIRELAAWHLARLLPPEARKEVLAAPNLPPEMLEQVRAQLLAILAKKK